MVRLIGDVHGKFSRYKRIIDECEESIQVGDIGIGFIGSDGRYLANPPYDAMVRGKHRFIRGNHDNPNVCKNHSQWIKDGTIENDIMFIGGALSIDRAYRTEGFDWWPDEELSSAELMVMVDIYQTTKPRVMITHECPEGIADLLMASNGRRKIEIGSRTRQAFDAMFEIHQPKLWVFGHWHVSFDHVIDGTRFICLDELEYRDIELSQ